MITQRMGEKENMNCSPVGNWTLITTGLAEHSCKQHQKQYKLVWLLALLAKKN